MTLIIALLLGAAGCGPECEQDEVTCDGATLYFCHDGRWHEYWECSGAGGNTVQVQALCRQLCDHAR